jgi:phosphoribosylaminoimidazolecarboxamide formyltransferase/IMP cyclohydrolase
MSDSRLVLRYGFNPHQAASISSAKGPLPFRVLNGTPSAINLMDAMNAWQLVRELGQALGLPAAASFKHVSPAGAALGLPLPPPLAQACLVDDMELSPLAQAYARARGTDRLSSYGDCAALSEPLDAATAALLRREVSDVLIAPGFDAGALDIVKRKKGSRYLVLEVDPDFLPPPREQRDLFGMILEQDRNTFVPGPQDLRDIVTINRDLAEDARRDALLSLIVLKYTQSNSIVLAWQGQTIGVGAGQQSRLHCARIAANKADLWFLRQHPRALELRFRPRVRRPERDNAVETFLSQESAQHAVSGLVEVLTEVPPRLTAGERADWLRTMQGVTLGSDALIPFRDTLDRCARSGVRYVVQAGGAARDEQVLAAANEHGMVMIHTGIRLFHH